MEFIRKSGSAYHKLELLLLLGDKHNEISSLLSEIELLQNQDGSWPWRWRHTNPGGVVETTKMIRILSKHRLRDVMRAISFINSIQRGDGGWSENPRLCNRIPEEWVFWRTDCSSAFFTGEVLCALIASDQKRDPTTERGLVYLQETQNEDGGWPLNSDPRHAKTDAICTNSAIIALIAAGHRKNSPILRRALRAIKFHCTTWMKAMQNTSEPYFATAILESLMTLDPENIHVTELVKYLVSIQRADGGWGWKELPSGPNNTLRCFRILTAVKDAHM